MIAVRSKGISPRSSRMNAPNASSTSSDEPSARAQRFAAYAVATDQAMLLEPAAVLALVGFLGTVAFARYLERRGRDE